MKRVQQGSSQPRKKRKVEKNVVIPVVDVEPNLKVDLLDSQCIRDGMLLLGCVTLVKPKFVVMSLPGCLTGIVPISNISSYFKPDLEDKRYKIENPPIFKCFENGMIFPCKVTCVVRDLVTKKPDITLSINPEDVYENLHLPSLYPKMVLYMAVQAKEDHGYMMRVNKERIIGFMESTDNNLEIGQVIPVCIQHIEYLNKNSASVKLSRLDCNTEFPVVFKKINLSTIFPGTKINVDIVEVKYPFVYMKYFDFDAFGTFWFPGDANKLLKIGSSVQGTVLYVDSFTHTIYLMLGCKPNPRLYDIYFDVKKYDIVQSLTYQFTLRKRAYFKVAKRTYGYLKEKDLPKNDECSSTGTSYSHNVPKACVTSMHYMDNLVQLSTKTSVLERKIISPEEVKIGDIYEAVVKEHKEEGMVVDICPGLHGFIRRIFMSDIFLTKPELVFPVGSNVTCRVVSTDGNNKVLLTSKETLINLDKEQILSSYESATKSQKYQGVIAQMFDKYFVVLFFNHVQGILPRQFPDENKFFVGQTISVTIFSCLPKDKKLSLRLETEIASEKLPVAKKSVCKKPLPEPGPSLEFPIQRALEYCDTVTNTKIKSSVPEPQVPVPAYIMHVSSEEMQVCIKLDGFQHFGRVHITEIGCTREGLFPMKSFRNKEKVLIHILGNYLRKESKYLPITHKRFLSQKECSLTYPPPVPLTKYFNKGDSVMGFLDQVNEGILTLWISPYVSGELDLLNFSRSIKVIRNACRNICRQRGVSISAHVIHPGGFRFKNLGRKPITLSKIDDFTPKVGENIVGRFISADFNEGVKLKLPFNYHGTVGMTDISDLRPDNSKEVLLGIELPRYKLCHVLEVDNETKHCVLSLRKSRLFNKKINFLDTSNFWKECTIENVKEGEKVYGFITKIDPPFVYVEFGRKLEGIAELHTCPFGSCMRCLTTKEFLRNNECGDCVPVIIERIFTWKPSRLILFEVQKMEKRNQNVTTLNLFNFIRK